MIALAKHVRSGLPNSTPRTRCCTLLNRASPMVVLAGRVTASHCECAYPFLVRYYPLGVFAGDEYRIAADGRVSQPYTGLATEQEEGLKWSRAA